MLDIVVPVYNEQSALTDSVHRLHAYLADAMPFRFRITIADNASTDDTPQIAARLAAELADVRVVRLEEKGRGRALRFDVTGWQGATGSMGTRPPPPSAPARSAGESHEL